MRLETTLIEGDARALQLRLYREVGLAAVAAALDGSAPDITAMLAPLLSHTPAIVPEQDAQELAA